MHEKDYAYYLVDMYSASHTDYPFSWVGLDLAKHIAELTVEEMLKISQSEKDTIYLTEVKRLIPYCYCDPQQELFNQIAKI